MRKPGHVVNASGRECSKVTAEANEEVNVRFRLYGSGKNYSFLSLSTKACCLAFTIRWIEMSVNFFVYTC
ncbi:MAG: hypothetical protein Q8R07_02340 [Candidatus Uhrbacteria bacterium]|nr:hypothetical protein [Candidatus Uhrbacteria bacterium]